jgi:hypothetical protein
VSEYQYYEFVAVDRPLDPEEQSAVRSLSTRARITDTSFVNEYEGGDFQGDPNQLMERYYDAHLYLANWGSRRVILRLPHELLSVETAARYCVDDQVTAWQSGDHLILDLTSEDEDADGSWDFEPEGTLSAIIGVRDEVAAGDHRPLYLAWLAAYGTWERDEDAFGDDTEDEREPPVPPGLGALTASQRELATFLRLDSDLLAVAAEGSRPRSEVASEADRIAGWLTGLSTAEKEQLLLRVATGEGAMVRGEMLRRFWGDSSAAAPGSPDLSGPDAASARTVGELLDGAAARRAAR